MTAGARLRLLLRLAAAAPGLPPSVVRFHARALRLAIARDDRFTLRSAAEPRQLAALLHLARGRRRAVMSCDPTGHDEGPPVSG